jgi:hypothetical protein
LSTVRDLIFLRVVHGLFFTAFFLSVTSRYAVAQANGAAPANEAEARLTLPDAPGLASSSNPIMSSTPRSSLSFSPFVEEDPPASSEPTRISKYVSPGQHTRPLSPGDKILLGFRGAFYPIPATGWLASASFSQALDHSPNYGTDTKAFFQRLGAAAARNSSEGIISDSIMATALHEDPRYYKLGTGNSFFRRLGNAVEHVVLTRSDDGRQTINYSLISGNLAGSALTNAYYPSRNRGFGSTMETFGLSLGGSAVGFTVAEFYSDAIEMLHKK